VLLERNVGEYDHARLQTEIAIYLGQRRREWNIRVVVEQRVQVKAARFRVPDVCVVLDEEPVEQIFTRPPFICIEILSPDDRLSEMQERLNDYLEFGVPYVFLLDPKSRRAYRSTPGILQEVRELRTGNPEIIVPLETLFS
jgi:Uma2 family endonuclease